MVFGVVFGATTDGIAKKITKSPNHFSAYLQEIQGVQTKYLKNDPVPPSPNMNGQIMRFLMAHCCNSPIINTCWGRNVSC